MNKVKSNRSMAARLLISRIGTTLTRENFYIPESRFLSKLDHMHAGMVKNRAKKQEYKMKDFKFRLYPTKTQEARLDHSINACRMLYNEFVAESRLAYREGYKVRFDELQRMIPAMVSKDAPLYSKAVQMVL